MLKFLVILPLIFLYSLSLPFFFYFLFPSFPSFFSSPLSLFPTGETTKPGVLKRSELDPNRSDPPDNRDSEINFTLLLQRTCKVGAVNTVHLLEEETYQQRNHQQITMEEGEGGSGSHTNSTQDLSGKQLNSGKITQN